MGDDYSFLQEKIKDEAGCPKRFKKRMNRFFREYVGGKIPYPEVDNFFERLRSKLDKRLKIK